jgi:hypothetical protein
MAKHQEKVKSSVPTVITGLVMVLLFGAFALFLVSQGQSIPNVEELHAQTRLKSRRSEQRKSEDPDPISLGRQD